METGAPPTGSQQVSHQTAILIESYAAGVVGILVFIIAAWIVMVATGIANAPTNSRWLGLIEGTDGRLSTSKFQWFIWTIAVVGGFAAVYAARALGGNNVADIGVPANVLTAVGFSTVTMATAKGITTAYTAGGRINKTTVTPTETSTPSASSAASSTTTTDTSSNLPPPTRGLLTDDEGAPDLSKIQLVTWTLIGVAIWIYLAITRVHYIVTATQLPDNQPLVTGLPDIPATLMVLMGLSQGGYLGAKLATMDKFLLSLDALVPSTAGPHDQVMLLGVGFGNQPDAGDAVLVGGVKADTTAAQWSDTKIVFLVPDTSPDGNAWQQNEAVNVKVVNSGHLSDSTQILTIASPALKSS